MTMADYITVVEEFESFLEDTLEISDIESFRNDYPKAYCALQIAQMERQLAAKRQELDYVRTIEDLERQKTELECRQRQAELDLQRLQANASLAEGAAHGRQRRQFRQHGARIEHPKGGLVERPSRVGHLSYICERGTRSRCE